MNYTRKRSNGLIKLLLSKAKRFCEKDTSRRFIFVKQDFCRPEKWGLSTMNSIKMKVQNGFRFLTERTNNFEIL